MSESSRIELDVIDRGIVRALQADGRRPFTRIARELGISEAAVRQRVGRLESTGTMQVVAVADPMALGYRTIAMLGVTVDPARRQAVADHLGGLDQVSYVVLVAGSFDLLVEVVCEDSEQLLAFLSGPLAEVEGVRAVESFVYLRLVKEAYTWSLAERPAADREAG